MATITVHPEHVEGLRYLLGCEFETACETKDRNALRKLINLGERIGWPDDEEDTFEVDFEIEARLSDALLEKLITEAWSHGNSMMAEVYRDRAQRGIGSGDFLVPDPEGSERKARSMLAFHEHMQGERVTS